MRSVHNAVALVVGQQLRPCWRLWLLQGHSSVKRLLGRIEGCLVDRWVRLLLWTCWSQWTFRLWRAVLELCRHQDYACDWAYSHACADSRAIANAHAYHCTKPSSQHSYTITDYYASTQSNARANNAIMPELCGDELESMYLDRWQVLPYFEGVVHVN